MKKLLIAAASLILLSACSVLGDQTPNFLLPESIYSGQTFKIGTSADFGDYEWSSSNRDIARVLTDGTPLLLCNLDGIKTKAFELNENTTSTDVVIMAYSKSHPEYTFESTVTIRPWRLAIVSDVKKASSLLGTNSAEVKAGEEFALVCYDTSDNSIITNFFDGSASAKENLNHIELDPSVESVPQIEVVSTSEFSAVFRAVSQGTAKIGVSLHNGCDTDSDVSSVITVTIK